jgi:2-polyprenyl-6-methoxyphenol hydroxylase-like FAD-dependent oxidoreductase
MNVVIAGGGMVGLTLGRLLRARGVEPVIIERMPEGAYIPRGYMLGFQGYEPLKEIGVLDEVWPEGREIAPQGGSAVAVCVEVGKVLHAIAHDLPVMYEHSVTELITDPSGRVTGVVAEGPDGEVTIPSDLVVACDGKNSRVRDMAGMDAVFDKLPEAELSWMSSTPSETSFSMAYMADGGHIGHLSWPQGSGGWRSCRAVGAEEALAPGLDAIKEMWARLLPDSRLGVEGIESIEQVRYSEPELLTTPEWWRPGIVLVGDSAHFFGPETGISSGIGLGDAHALAEAIAQNKDDADRACESYVTWRAPVVRPYEAMDPGRQRILVAGQQQPAPGEAWPPAD